ncbi:MAG: L-seryl-tRNA(Sec) selenium transferase [Candidatus Marinimicrobia bacterium]|jgi:L-seryl-tRNA(Ser) seleniumtransferase|nr:L-seryl-tRNA(Sec) selenium transferase [Candidatus Neomarinimicrobiota bacterium]MBT3618389.1 L-seryl-tRNA(Sec) selenium transferase [Candidatus Neomarinimicrobiota bacterium]MBT3829184.1 L-seryl-tRNA(Sec) selenium transferase [Candidatus Neomarinimicrobiota bacterium]MBT3998152.1 L-seryl-tRNA(Sec) selenium transferase [Candidatus Neomarinimicrobiota bacterium]MBT4281493.1 L-seryl-tRNA(Sec) selenium transferase [Candidatus Neomarinimicrobiota bacterium]
MSKSQLKSLPSVSEVLLEVGADMSLHNDYIKYIINQELKWMRSKAKGGNFPDKRKQILKKIIQKIKEAQTGSHSSVINGTGIVLHTGFGRAPMSKKIIKSVTAKLEQYSNIELDLSSGKRGQRQDHCRRNLSALCRSDDSMAVNNNAAAVFLCLNTFAEGKEVIISRGQEVEIGGSFRIPDVIRKSGCKMVEVGTTNRTRIEDYQKAISKNTALLLWVHTSNYIVKGFTQSVDLTDLVALGRKAKIPVLADLGSGALVDMDAIGLPQELPVSAVIKSGVDVVTFSGDKLLGGPQSGLIAGKKKHISTILNNPIYRTVRCDKWTIALLDETLRHYGNTKSNLALNLLKTSRMTLKSHAEKILKGVLKKKQSALGISIVETEVEAGSGSLPDAPLPSVALRFSSNKYTASKLSAAFRKLNYPIVGYCSGRAFFIDLKAILPGQHLILTDAINQI